MRDIPLLSLANIMHRAGFRERIKIVMFMDAISTVIGEIAIYRVISSMVERLHEGKSKKDNQLTY